MRQRVGRYVKATRRETTMGEVATASLTSFFFPAMDVDYKCHGDKDVYGVHPAGWLCCGRLYSPSASCGAAMPLVVLFILNKS
ncbi:hypothetical protein MRX96_059113 [Rhipicephalus microplus]